VKKLLAKIEKIEKLSLPLAKKNLIINQAIKQFCEENLKVNTDIRNLLETISTNGMFNRLLTVPQAATVFGVGRKTIYRLINEKKIKIVKITSDATRIDRRDLEKFIQTRKDFK